MNKKDIEKRKAADWEHIIWRKCAGGTEIWVRLEETENKLSLQRKFVQESMKPMIDEMIKEAIRITRKKIIEEIKPTDLIVPCKPDCTPEEHAYHEGTWDSYLKLEKILTKLKKAGE